jgi:hypothetical protein
MSYRALAVATAFLHFAYIVVLVGGAYVVWRRPRFWRVHILAVIAMVIVRGLGHDCPLTWLENRFRVRGGWDSYEPQGFISHYLVRPWHPSGINLGINAAIAAIWIVPNVLVYGSLVRRWRQRNHAAATSPPVTSATRSHDVFS